MIEIKNLTFGYYKARKVFDTLSTTFESGRIYGLLGRNGAGKTTLLKLITGLLYPWEGDIDIDGYKAQRREPDYLNRIFMIPEEFYLPKIKIQTFVKTYAPFYPNFDYDKFYEILDTFEIPVQNKLTGMSYGQKKKFYISFGLATNVPMLIMDEPTNGMDIPSKTNFRRLTSAALDDKKTIIISTHQVRDVEGLIDNVKIIEKGKIIFDQEYARVQEKFALLKTDEKPENVVFSVKVLGGYVSLIEADSEHLGAKIDLELLFNAVMANAQSINEIFKN